MIYKVTITPDRPADFQAITFYTENEADVRKAVEFWTAPVPGGETVKVVYDNISWVPFDTNSTYRFTNVTGEEYT